jgi:hypothetical protein
MSLPVISGQIDERRAMRPTAVENPTTLTTKSPPPN